MMVVVMVMVYICVWICVCLAVMQDFLWNQALFKYLLTKPNMKIRDYPLG